MTEKILRLSRFSPVSLHLYQFFNISTAWLHSMAFLGGLFSFFYLISYNLHNFSYAITNLFVLSDLGLLANLTFIAPLPSFFLLKFQYYHNV